MGIQIEQVDSLSAPESLLRAMEAHYRDIDAEDMPDDPPIPYEMRVAEWRHVPEHHPFARWVLREDGHVSASAVAAFHVDQNLENGFAKITVHPDRRGRGYARALAGPVFDHLDAAGRHRLDTWIKRDIPAESFAERLGLEAVYGEKRSRLTIADVDRGLMQSWIDRATERAGDYELTSLTAPVPEEMVQELCDLALVMNTAPREDFEEEDEVVTPEDWRDTEDAVLKSQCRLNTLVAVHRPTGELAGFTEIKTQDLQPDLAWQWATGVVTKHRNRGLGHWLKATMILQIMSDYPQVERIDTFNAGSNQPMLSINTAMGFRVVHESNQWQGEMSTIRERLGV
jgi:GNAT superfamily N-acetyltransferase